MLEIHKLKKEIFTFDKIEVDVPENLLETSK